MFTGLLDRSVAFMSSSVTRDAYGGQSVTLATVISPVPCRIRQLSLSERDILMRQGIDSNYRIYCDGNITVLSTYVARLDDGKDYEVTNPHDVDMLGRILQIDVNRKETGAV
ncbi:MAG: head-tail adaptor protein [Smithellaceae bacterium]|nr:head-tail adaptor protein [Smithellaceae bacterium]